ncbi:MAG: hypothetical protein AAB908_02085 [Patescibacteria group bacterium]
MVLFGPPRRLGKVEREILESMTTSDVLVGFVCSARSSRRMYKIAYERARARYRTRKVIDSLVAKGYVDQNGDLLTITDDGRRALENTVQKIRSSLASTVWDGKWRIVAYDIPATHSKLRDEVRYVLKKAGFHRLHHSVWIFPHDCHELIDLIKGDRRLKSCLLYGVLESIENDETLRTHFGVKV